MSTVIVRYTEVRESYIKIKEGFILRKIAGEDISKEELVNSLIKEYEIDENLATNDVKGFLNILEEHKAIEGV